MMFGSSLLAQVQSLNHELREENDRMYGMLQLLLSQQTPSKSTVHLREEVEQHREAVKRHGRLS